eukprot:scaffold442_cov268-Pinguiococcus_pyrenoidosus.AAC.25
MTQFYGEFRTGKTQLMHTMCVTSQLGLEQGGGMGKVLYIDTEGNFRPQRIQQIADRFGLEARSVGGRFENIPSMFVIFVSLQRDPGQHLCQAMLHARRADRCCHDGPSNSCGRWKLPHGDRGLRHLALPLRVPGARTAL